MALEQDHYCPSCGATKAFYRSGSTLLHLGEKVKWACPDCDYGFIEVNGIVSDEAEV